MRLRQEWNPEGEEREKLATGRRANSSKEFFYKEERFSVMEGEVKGGKKLRHVPVQMGCSREIAGAML